MLKQIFKVFLLVIGVIVAIALLGWFLHVVSLIISLAIGLALLVGLVYLIGFLFKIQVRTEPDRDESCKVCDYGRQSVALFVREPSVKDLVRAQQISPANEEAHAGSLFAIDNDTKVIIITDEKEKDAVRVRVAQGPYKGQEGWICRSVLHKSTPEKHLRQDK